MSAERAAWIRCDACEETSNAEVGGAGPNIADARASTKAEGWHRRPGGRDICPECWDAGER